MCYTDASEWTAAVKGGSSTHTGDLQCLIRCRLKAASITSRQQSSREPVAISFSDVRLSLCTLFSSINGINRWLLGKNKVWPPTMLMSPLNSATRLPQQCGPLSKTEAGYLGRRRSPADAVLGDCANWESRIHTNTELHACQRPWVSFYQMLTFLYPRSHPC